MDVIATADALLEQTAALLAAFRQTNESFLEQAVFGTRLDRLREHALDDWYRAGLPNEYDPAEAERRAAQVAGVR